MLAACSGGGSLSCHAQQSAQHGPGTAQTRMHARTHQRRSLCATVRALGRSAGQPHGTCQRSDAMSVPALVHKARVCASYVYGRGATLLRVHAHTSRSWVGHSRTCSSFCKSSSWLLCIAWSAARSSCSPVYGTQGIKDTYDDSPSLASEHVPVAHASCLMEHQNGDSSGDEIRLD